MRLGHGLFYFTSCSLVGLKESSATRAHQLVYTMYKLKKSSYVYVRSWSTNSYTLFCRKGNQPNSIKGIWYISSFYFTS